MAPADKTNVVFKVSLYGVPHPNTYQGDRLNIFVQAGKMAGVPLYIGEWNNLSPRVALMNKAIFNRNKS